MKFIILDKFFIDAIFKIIKKIYLILIYKIKINLIDYKFKENIKKIEEINNSFCWSLINKKYEANNKQRDSK